MRRRSGARHRRSIAILAAACLLVAATPEDETVSRTLWLMGTRAHVEVRAPTRQAASRASEDAVRAMADVESLLSTWREDSELARLNRMPAGAPARPVPAVAAWLREAAHLSRRTERAFDPTVGALVDAWDLRGEGRIPSETELDAAIASSGSSALHIDPGSGAVTRLRGAAWMDAGAFGKGAALRAARDRLADAGITRASLELGGQVVVVGPTAARVSVAHPVHRDRAVRQLRVADASVATSGQSERGFDLDGERFGHVLDPRTGRPVPAWGSVTVVSPDPLEADVLSTALYVMGPVEGLRWATEEGVAALFLHGTGRGGLVERTTPALAPWLEGSGSAALHLDRASSRP